MGFQLQDYEQVDSRIKAFYKDFPEGSIITEDQHSGANHAYFKAYLYRDSKAVANKTPWATGYAWEDRAKELSTTKSGKEYEDVNYSSWVENCETSAIGRALANAGYSKKERPSREEMEKVSRYKKGKRKAKKKAEGTLVKCQDCDKELSSDEISWCQSFYDGMYCKKCQRNHDQKSK